MKREIRFTLNNKLMVTEVYANQMLIHVLRNNLGFTGTKEGCGKGECGVCTVLVNSCNVNSCLYPAFEVHGKCVTTIEGLLGECNHLDPLQEAFIDQNGIQCGYCTPGMIMSAKALLIESSNPTEAEIRRGLSGNLCRCTGYVQIIESVKKAAQS